MSKQKAQRRTYTGHYLSTIWQKLEEVQEELGFHEYMQTIEYLIIFGHDKIVNSYRTRSQARPVKDLSSPEDLASRRIAREKEERDARKNIVESEAMQMCQDLEGEIIDNGNGYKSCKFNQYDLSTPNFVSVGVMEVPFDQLASHHVINQYKTDLPGYNNKIELKNRILEVLKNQG